MRTENKKKLTSGSGHEVLVGKASLRDSCGVFLRWLFPRVRRETLAFQGLAGDKKGQSCAAREPERSLGSGIDHRHTWPRSRSIQNPPAC